MSVTCHNHEHPLQVILYDSDFNPHRDLQAFAQVAHISVTCQLHVCQLQVILYDSDFNPHRDLQALARCHRIGQDNKVLCSSN